MNIWFKQQVLNKKSTIFDFEGSYLVTTYLGWKTTLLVHSYSLLFCSLMGIIITQRSKTEKDENNLFLKQFNRKKRAISTVNNN